MDHLVQFPARGAESGVGTKFYPGTDRVNNKSKTNKYELVFLSTLEKSSVFGYGKFKYELFVSSSSL